MTDRCATYSGGQFHPLNPNPDEVRIEDIAHSLSLLCRFGGHTRDFYSVGEHSCRVADLLEPKFKLHGLLHDAAEAYIADLVRPIKYSGPFMFYREMDEHIQAVIFTKYGLEPTLPAPCKIADDILLATEFRDLLNHRGENWGMVEEPMGEIIVPWSPSRAEMEFLARFRELTK